MFFQTLFILYQNLNLLFKVTSFWVREGSVEHRGASSAVNKNKSRGDESMEGREDERKWEKSPLHRLHSEAQGDGTGIVTSFNTPPQREGGRGKGRCCKKKRKGQKGRDERGDRLHLCLLTSKALWVLRAVWCGVCSVSVRSHFDLALLLHTGGNRHCFDPPEALWPGSLQSSVWRLYGKFVKLLKKSGNLTQMDYC